MIALFDKRRVAEVGCAMSLFASVLPVHYTLDETRAVDIGGIGTPIIKVADKVFNRNFAIPERFLERSGAVVTVFVRVTISLKK